MATRSSPISLTLGLCIAGGLAAGVALARPASGASDQPAPAASTADSSGEPRYEYPSVADLEAAAEPAAITIAEFAYGDAISVAAGSEVTVTNTDGAPHTVTGTDVDFDTGMLGQSETATIIVPDEPGTYAFFCTVHPTMQGELVVT